MRLSQRVQKMTSFNKWRKPFRIDISEFPLPTADEYPTPSAINDKTDPYVIARIHDYQVLQLFAGATLLIESLLKDEGTMPTDEAGVLGNLAFYLAHLEALDVESLLIGHLVNPFLDLLLEARDLVPRGAAASQMPLRGQQFPAELIQQLREVITRVRERAASPEWQRRVETIARKCRDNHASMKNYLDALYERRGARHLVLRIDFGYTRDHASLMSRGCSISEECAKADLDKLMRHVRENYPLTGFARRMEYGVYSGLHFHVMILLDGHKARCDARIARLLGEYWRDVVTEGQGRYYNCNRVFYRCRGIGMINYSDEVKRHYLLEYAARYLTKADFWVQGDSGGKAFVRGQMPDELATLRKPRLYQPTTLGPTDESAAEEPPRNLALDPGE